MKKMLCVVRSSRELRAPVVLQKHPEGQLLIIFSRPVDFSDDETMALSGKSREVAAKKCGSDKTGRAKWTVENCTLLSPKDIEQLIKALQKML